MDFREHQAQAKKNSKKIWILYFLLLIVSSSLTGGMAAGFFVADGSMVLFSEEYFVTSAALAIIALIVLIISTLVGFFKNSNGKSVAESFGGILITAEGVKSDEETDIENHLNKMIANGEEEEAYRIADLYDEGKIKPSEILGYTRDSDLRPLTKNEKRALNIIQEQSLAASMPCPPLYLIPDKALNAFAAGKKKSNSIVAITQGSLDTFNRDEMSGIIAHELGHIISEDVKLNIRVAALVFGFTALFVMGRLAFHSAINSNSDGKAKLIKILLGVGILAVGLLTVFFGKILQAAMSRQREYLADASAIQFTRNPDGLVSAFNLIKGSESGVSEIDSPASANFSHAFIFGIDSSILSTHPPLNDRIKRIKRRPHE